MRRQKEKKVYIIRYHHLIVSINCNMRQQVVLENTKLTHMKTAQTLTSNHTYQVHICTSKETLFYDKDEFLNDVGNEDKRIRKCIFWSGRDCRTIRRLNQTVSQTTNVKKWKRSMLWRSQRRSDIRLLFEGNNGGSLGSAQQKGLFYVFEDISRAKQRWLMIHK